MWSEMSNLEYQIFYRRHLPHFQPPGATLFITFRLAGSIPQEVVIRLCEESERVEARLNRIPDISERKKQLEMASRRFFGRWDKVLDCEHNGFLRDPRIASMVAGSLHNRDGTVYHLIAFCIMPNHVHLICQPIERADGSSYSLSEIMHSLKRYTARQANLIIEREGQFWQHENYDHVVHDEAELDRIINYTVENPVKAGLVHHWREWQWSYCRYDL
jgi:REP element-mobilizing transposase RayT